MDSDHKCMIGTGVRANEAYIFLSFDWTHLISAKQPGLAAAAFRMPAGTIAFDA